MNVMRIDFQTEANPVGAISMNDVFSQRPGRRVPISALTAIAMMAVPLLCHGQFTISVVAGTGNSHLQIAIVNSSGPNPFLTPFSVFVPLTHCLTFGVRSTRKPWFGALT
jgi:hypothetical protein